MCIFSALFITFGCKFVIQTPKLANQENYGFWKSEKLQQYIYVLKLLYFVLTVYVEQARSATATTLAFTIGTTTTVATWNIKVSQIECSSRSR